MSREQNNQKFIISNLNVVRNDEFYIHIMNSLLNWYFQIYHMVFLYKKIHVKSTYQQFYISGANVYHIFLNKSEFAEYIINFVTTTLSISIRTYRERLMSEEMLVKNLRLGTNLFRLLLFKIQCIDPRRIDIDIPKHIIMSCSFF